MQTGETLLRSPSFQPVLAAGLLAPGWICVLIIAMAANQTVRKESVLKHLGHVYRVLGARLLTT